MTEEIFRQDSYMKSCEAQVVGVDENGIRLDRTVFYPTGGGQPGDSGFIEPQDGGDAVRIVDTRKGAGDGEILHIPEHPAPAALLGQSVRVTIDTFEPTNAFTSVDFPALGAPRTATNPQRV